jgi:hypothetical protein
MNNRSTSIRFHIFSGYEVRVILAANLERTGRRLGADCRGCAAAFLTRPDKAGFGWMIFGPKPDAATIAHESSHAVRALFRYAGAKADDEAFAYHLDYLVGRIHKFIDRRRK